MKRKYIFFLGVVFLLILLAGSASHVARAMDTNYPRDVTVYFLKAGAPYNEPLDFAINCYDFPSQAMTYPSDGYLVYTYSNHCEEYGCKLVYEEPPMFYGYCDMSVSAPEGNYLIAGYSNFPFGICETFDWGDTCTLALELTASTGSGLLDSPIQSTPMAKGYFVLAWLLTILSETAILVLLARFVFKSRVGLAAIVGTGILASSLTLPYLWFVSPLNVYVNEAIVILTEAVIYKWILKMKLWHVLAISLATNLVSFIAGIVFF